MPEVKKIKKRRFNILKFLIVVLFLYIIINAFIKLYKTPIKNIVVLNNKYLSDETIIESANIADYPSFIKSTCSSICKRIKKTNLVEDCNCNKSFGYKVQIDIKEYKILYKLRSNEKYVLSNGSYLDQIKVNNYEVIPVLINYVTDEINDKLIEKFSLLEIEIINKISEIEYTPTTYDAERFILYMKDKNMVYINLNKLDNLNKYNEIKKELEGNVGILYLDSGNYFEIKD